MLAAGRVGRGQLRIRRRWLGGRSVVGSCSSRVSHGDEVDAASAQFFVNSSLAPVLLFRRRVKSVAAVLKGFRQHGFTQGRWGAALQQFLGRCVSSGPLWASAYP